MQFRCSNEIQFKTVTTLQASSLILFIFLRECRKCAPLVVKEKKILFISLSNSHYFLLYAIIFLLVPCLHLYEITFHGIKSFSIGTKVAVSTQSNRSFSQMFQCRQQSSWATKYRQGLTGLWFAWSREGRAAQPHRQAPAGTPGHFQG